MDAQNQSLQDLQHIKKMMERSSRFISLSGLSGVSAGVCALIGAWFAEEKISSLRTGDNSYIRLSNESGSAFQIDLIVIALLTFAGAFLTSFLFTYLRSKKEGTSLWDSTTISLFWNTVIP